MFFSTMLTSETISTRHILEAISQHYTPLSEECKQDLMQCSAVHYFEKSTFLVREGEYADKFYFIASGAARAFYVKDEKDITAWFSFENEFINALDSYFRNVPSPHYIEILEPSIVWEISKSQAKILARQHPDFDNLSKKIILGTLLALNDRVVSLQFATAKERYESLLAVRPDITNRVPLNYIASFLGITVETLSRIRNPKYTNPS
jgi:CRP-like cAMP-binding protein